MPTWGNIAREIQEAAQEKGPLAFDFVRRSYLAKAHQKTGRAIILYATSWTLQQPNVPPAMQSIHDGDLQGLMEVFNEVGSRELDLIIHSPGGSIDAAAAMVSYLRSKFDHIRAIIPNAAMSAAGMIACACDRLVMGKHSFIGPADPQFNLPSPLGGMRQVAVQSITEQFEKAKRECMEDQRALAVWAPLLAQYGPDLIVQAERASKLSQEYVEKWLRSYMFCNDDQRDGKAQDISSWLSTHENFNSHGRHINRAELREHGLIVDSLENDQEEQDLFLSVFHAAMHTMMGTGAAKIIENHAGKAFINQMMMVPIPTPAPAPVQPPPPPLPAPAAPAA